MTKTSKGTRGMTVTGIARKDVVDFFEKVSKRRFSDAERVIEKVRGRKLNTPEFRDGYVKALEGFLLSSRSGDERDFHNKENMTPKNMREYKKFFRDFMEQGMRSPYDIGYFSAWSDLMQYRAANKK